MGFAGGGVNGQFRWKELALDQLLPIDEEREEQKRAAQARKMATGSTSHAPTTQRNPAQAEGGDDDEDDEDEDDEEGEDEDEDEEDSEEED